jgi:RNA polymerase sigma factor (sigma-70 family)
VDYRHLSNRDLAIVLAKPRASRLAVVEAYRRFMPMLIVRAGVVLQDHVRYAEDVAQETLTKILDGGMLAHLRDPEQIGTFLLTATKRAAIDLLRALSRETLVVETPELDGFLDRAAIDRERNEMRQEISEILTHLPEDDRAILRARFLEDQSLADIASKAGILYFAAGQRVSRALRRARAYASGKKK